MAKIYDITDKLEFGEDPKIRIKDMELTVRSDADVLLRVMDLYRNKNEMDAAIDSIGLLLSEEDREKLSGLHLKINDYASVIRAMVDLAMGNDPDEDEEKN